MTLQQNLSDAINTIFFARKQTLTSFAKELDISRCCLHDILNGTANPRLETIEHIAKNLNIDPQSLVTSPTSTAQLKLFSALQPVTDSVSKLSEKKKKEYILTVSKMMNMVSGGSDR